MFFTNDTQKYTSLSLSIDILNKAPFLIQCIDFHSLLPIATNKIPWPKIQLPILAALFYTNHMALFEIFGSDMSKNRSKFAKKY